MSEPAHIRPAVLDDAPELARLMGELGYPTDAFAMRTRLEKIFAAPHHHTLVADAGSGRLAGLCGLRLGLFYERDTPFVQIAALVVDSGQVRTGVGRRLVHEAERWARTRGALDLVVTSNLRRAQAHRFYESLGYERTGYRFHKILAEG